MRGPFTDADITRAAESMIKDYGANAVSKAAAKVAAARKDGRDLIATYWNQIELEIRKILSNS